MKYIRLLFILLFGNVLFGQSMYELKFLKGEFDEILLQSQNLADSIDYYWNALMLERKGELQKSIAILESGLESDSSHSLEQLLASFYFQSGQYPKAKPLLKKHLANAELFLYYVKVLEFEENNFTALKVLNSSLEADSMNVIILKHLGFNYASMDSLDLAIDCYKKLHVISPNDQLTAQKLIALYLKKKEYTRSITICDTILAADSLNARFIKLRARANFSIPDLDAAIVDFSNLYSMGDSSKFVLKHLAISEINKGLFTQGREHIRIAYQIDSSDYETTFYMGKAYLNSVNPEVGIYYLDRTIELLQPEPKLMSAIYLEKQSVYSTILKYDEALKCYESAYKYNPNPEYLFYMASVYEFNINDLEMALEYYNQFLEVLPDKVEHEGAGVKQDDPNQITVSLKNVAELRIAKLKEELFFKGEN